ncbi:DEKNAAC103865 [Brettanomyces naardenensis]|uniref:F-actin-capping protein subunit alpha n=1 Tax=Brettanomyces naardenensis TaxID=13370 RepID=A0A448YPG4_BRENA|nr:DEKNAAC103865 [Brettanomyces naardenensis]
MSESLQSIIGSMIEDAPPGNSINLQKDLKTILNNDNSRKLIADKLKQYHLNKDYKLVKLTDTDFGIISKYNQSGLKYYDPALKLKFDYDFDNLKVIDVEQGGVKCSEEVEQLNERIRDYALQHYPTFYKGIAVEDGDNENIVYVIIVDENLNDGNFYNGKWQSFYQLNKLTGELSGEIIVKVHYYEDGNVILNTGSHVKESGVGINNIIDVIGKVEDEFEVKLVKKFSKLNDDEFKNLRRQLPINRSKVQWGKAIGNYTVGKEAAEGAN